MKLQLPPGALYVIHRSLKPFQTVPSFKRCCKCSDQSSVTEQGRLESFLAGRLRLKNKSNQIRSRNLPHVIHTTLVYNWAGLFASFGSLDDILARVGGVWGNSLLVAMSQIRPVIAFVTL